MLHAHFAIDPEDRPVPAPVAGETVRWKPSARPRPSGKAVRSKLGTSDADRIRRESEKAALAWVGDPVRPASVFAPIIARVARTLGVDAVADGALDGLRKMSDENAARLLLGLNRELVSAIFRRSKVTSRPIPRGIVRTLAEEHRDSFVRTLAGLGS